MQEATKEDNQTKAPESEAKPMTFVERLKAAWHFVRDQNHSGAVMAIFTVVIALTGIFYTVFAALQWCQMIESNKINRESLETVQRAFLNYDGIQWNRFHNQLPNGNSWVFEAANTNSGTTPAINVMQHFAVEELPNGLSEANFIGDAAQAKNYIGTVGPKGRLFISAIFKTDRFVFGKDVTIDWKHPEQFQTIEIRPNVFFWGWIVYRDKFPKTSTHVLEFCQTLNGITANKEARIFQLAFMNCSQHNCTDEDCQDYRQLIDAIPQ